MKMKLHGKYIIESENIITGEKTIQQYDNLILQAFYDKIFGFMNYSTTPPDADSMDISYIAIGDDDTAPTMSDTTLGNELARKIYASKTYASNVFTYKAAITADAGNPPGGYIKEVGMFVNGSETTDSGTLISRAIVNIIKNANIKLNIIWQFTLTEG